jgi:predicted nucleic acid-binding protein
VVGRHGALGRHARRVFDAAESGGAGIYVPTLVLVEVLEASRRGVIELAGGSTAWTEGLLAHRSFFAVDRTAAIVLRAEEFYAIPERGDRLIAATAAVLDVPLITRDPEIGGAGVEVVW